MNIFILIVFLYLIPGIYFMILDTKMNEIYLGIIIFFTFKWIFNYRKCTISRIECLLRRVKKEQGYLYRFLNNLVDLRYTEEFIVILPICILYILYNIFYKKQYMKYLKSNI